MPLTHVQELRPMRDRSSLASFLFALKKNTQKSSYRVQSPSTPPFLSIYSFENSWLEPCRNGQEGCSDILQDAITQMAEALCNIQSWGNMYQ